jgi:glycosyltransferase involved in cell wall biosynthesis
MDIARTMTSKKKAASTSIKDNKAHENRSVEAVEPRPDAPYDTEFPNLKEFIDKVDSTGKKLKVCIATEDIVGPIRNGGIGTTYTHLSKLLAKTGHDVCIAYLRGYFCQNKSIQYWIDWYQSFGVTFIPVDPEEVKLISSAPRWIRPMAALYEFLKKESFDLVHVSEWRGAGYLSLLAKKQGLAFENTTFCVKTSSPYLWNRENGYHNIDRVDELPKIYAEKQSVELADFVIGGSRYLLCWMLEHGYHLPKDRSYVQPNVLFPLDLDKLANPRRELYGKRIEIGEIVFFGRIEYRKGLDIFFKALKRLVDDGVKLPPITLMGKYGDRIPTHPELSIKEYISKYSKQIGQDVNVLSNFGNREALSYLLEEPRLAVMPSRIENSTLAAYEATYYGIPCVVTDTGGTAELIASEHHEKVLTAPNPMDLSKKLKTVISQGGFIPAPSFDNQRNLETWSQFHDAMGAYINNGQTAGKGKREQSFDISICLTISGENERAYVSDFLNRCMDFLANGEIEIILVNNGCDQPTVRTWIEQIKGESGSGFKLIDNVGYGVDCALNRGAQAATGNILVFPEVGTLLKPEYIATLLKAAANSDAGVFGCFYHKVNKPAEVEMSGSAPYATFSGDFSSNFYEGEFKSPVLAVRRDTFFELGGFNEDDNIPGAAHEFALLACLNNVKVESIPEPIACVVEEYDHRKRLNHAAEPYRMVRPFLENAPQCYKRILMTASGIVNTGSTGDGTFSSMKSFVRNTNTKAGNWPKFREFAISCYAMQFSVFRSLVNAELKIFRGILNIKNDFDKIKFKK